MRSSTEYDLENLCEIFLNKADGLGFTKSKKKVDIVTWAEKLKLGSSPFHIAKHEYQVDLLNANFQKQIFKKGAQVGLSTTQVVRALHGLIFGKYKRDVAYCFPTFTDVTNFSKSYFKSIIENNPLEIGRFLRSTDSVEIKQVNESYLRLLGTRSSVKIAGIKDSSGGSRGFSADLTIFDECDLMQWEMVAQFQERLSHSELKEEVFLSVPSINDYGIDRLFNQSDQRVWEIRCSHCGTGSVLELEFPGCLLELSDGRVIRACKKCKKEIFPRDGRWVAQYPERSKDMVGWWISQLNSAYVEPSEILKAFNDPPNGNITEVYNSKLAMAYVSAENRLNISDIYSCCGLDAMAMDSLGPCAMGVDVGKLLHVVVGFKPRDKVLEVCYLARVSSFNDLHDIAKRFNVQCAVLDMEPEMRKAREFAEGENYPVFLCDYQDRISAGPQWDEEKKLVRAQRTDLCDTTHELFANPGRLILPRKCEEVDRFAQQCRNIAKVLEEDLETGSREYRYRKLAEDHGRHALNYLYLASQRIGLVHDARGKMRIPDHAEIDFNPFNYSSQPEDPWR